MEVLAWLLVGLAGYLPGSVPAGLIAGRMKGIDLRKVGSGNIGATNALRTSVPASVSPSSFSTP